MAESITPNAIATMLERRNDDPSSIPDIVIQVLDLKQMNNKYAFTANDGKKKLRGAFSSDFSAEILAGKLQNLGLVRVLAYNVADVERLIVVKAEVVCSVLEMEIKEKVEPGIKLEKKLEFDQSKPKQPGLAKSANQIMREQNMPPVARMAMTRRVCPVGSLHPYMGKWTIKVRVTDKGNLRSYTNARGSGHVFNVTLADEEGTQIQATMFNEAATKFYDVFQLKKAYYVSNGVLKVANKQYKTLKNEYEMTLNSFSLVEEALDNIDAIPELVFEFVKIDQLASFVGTRQLVDLVGVVVKVADTMPIRRKSDGVEVPKRDITVADDSKSTVIISLWGDHATGVGEELLGMADQLPVVVLKSLKVGDFQGVSLATLSKSTILINPDLPQAQALRSWFDAEGKDTQMDSISSTATPRTFNMFTERVMLSDITSRPDMGEEKKPVFFSVKACINRIKTENVNLWYTACKICNRKVVDGHCVNCSRTVETCLRFMMSVQLIDPSGEAWVSMFNDQAESILGCSADEYHMLVQNGGAEEKIEAAKWIPRVFRVTVAAKEYQNEKRQRIGIKTWALVDFVAEAKFLLEEMSKLQAPQGSQ